MTLEEALREVLLEGSEIPGSINVNLKARDLAERIEQVYTAGFRDGGRYAPHRLVSNRENAVAAFQGDESCAGAKIGGER